MKLIKLSGRKKTRIIKGSKYKRLDKTVLAVSNFNSYINSSSNAYLAFIKKAYDKLTKNEKMDENSYVVFGEIIREKQKRSLYLTIFEKVENQ